MVHRLTWLKSSRGDQQLSEYLILALMDSGASAALQDDNQEYVFVANLPEIWKLKPEIKPSDVSLFGDAIADRLALLKASLKALGDKGSFEVKLDNEQVFEFRVQVISSASGIQYLITIMDLSRERRREKLLETLLRDVSHRSKNLLAIIQSIAAQTARYTASLDQFLHQFRGRLYSLAQSQDLVTDSSWRGAYFRELVRQQTGKYIPEDSGALVVDGDDALLTPNASLHLGLALHELIVNAARRGSLGDAGHPVRLSCLVTGDGDRDWIDMTWTETVPASSTPTGTGEAQSSNTFGDVVLERVVPASVGGTARYDTSNSIIRYNLRFPL